jgi:hypothetical protein
VGGASSRLSLDGKQPVTRKNPHVIDVGLELSFQLSY